MEPDLGHAVQLVAQFRLDFRSLLEAGKVSSLVEDHGVLSSAQRFQMPCGDLRKFCGLNNGVIPVTVPAAALVAAEGEGDRLALHRIFGNTVGAAQLAGQGALPVVRGGVVGVLSLPHAGPVVVDALAAVFDDDPQPCRAGDGHGAGIVHVSIVIA